MKKWITTVVTMAMTTSLLAGCGGSSATATPEVDNDNKLSVVTTIFPIYDWTSEILGDNLENVDLTMLLDDGVDVHSFQATADDMIAIAECDLFIYVGGESDAWVEDALKNAVNPDMQVLNLMEVLGDSVKVEEMVEGMEETEHSHDHAEDEEDHDHDHEEGELDEHVWLSLKNAEVICNAIAEVLTSLDEANAELYAANLEAYVANLQALDVMYAEVVAAATYNTVLFGDRFPFRYLVDDYNLDYYAAFAGCSAETEASFETIAFLAAKVDELELPAVLTIEGVTHKIAETVVATTESKDQSVLTVYSMQSVAASDIAAGATYLSIMEENLKVLAEALA